MLDGRLHAVLAVITGDLYGANRHAVLASQVTDADVEVLVILKHVVVQNLQGDHLLCLTGAEGQCADCLNVVSIRGCGAVLCLVVDLQGGVHVLAFTNNSYFKGANALHDGVVGRVKHDAGHAIILLLNLSSSSLSISSSLLSLSLSSQCFVGVFLSGKLASGLSTVISTGFWTLGHHFLPGLDLQVNQADIRVFQADSLHGVDVLATTTLKLSQHRVQLIKVLKLTELLLRTVLNVSLL